MCIVSRLNPVENAYRKYTLRKHYEFSYNYASKCTEFIARRYYCYASKAKSRSTPNPDKALQHRTILTGSECAESSCNLDNLL